MIIADLARLLRVAADECDAIAAEERQTKSDWTDQHRSALGAKRHNAAVRRLLADGLPGAAIVGRRHLLSADALNAELRRTSTRTGNVKAAGVADQLRAELRLVGGSSQ